MGAERPETIPKGSVSASSGSSYQHQEGSEKQRSRSQISSNALCSDGVLRPCRPGREAMRSRSG